MLQCCLIRGEMQLTLLLASLPDHTPALALMHLVSGLPISQIWLQYPPTCVHCLLYRLVALVVRLRNDAEQRPVTCPTPSHCCRQLLVQLRQKLKWKVLPGERE